MHSEVKVSGYLRRDRVALGPARRLVWMSLWLCLALGAASAAQETANSILEKVDRIRSPQGSFVMQVTITTQNGAQAEQVHSYEAYVQDANQTLVRFTSPSSERGKALLMLEQDLWVYLPNVGKPIRIPLAQRLVGNVANGDIARLNYAGDYDATVSGSDALDGHETHVLDLTAKTKGMTYGKIRLWVVKENFRPLKAEFYALSGQLLKIGLYENYTPVLGELRPTSLVLIDKVRTGLVSRLEYRDMQTQDIPAKFFNKNYLKNLE